MLYMYMHAASVSLRAACMHAWPRSRRFQSSWPSLLDRLFTHSIPILPFQGMERHGVAACVASNETRARSIEHGNQLPDDHCIAMAMLLHSCTHARAVASHIDGWIEKPPVYFTTYEQIYCKRKNKKHKLVRDIIRRHRRSIGSFLMTWTINLLLPWIMHVQAVAAAAPVDRCAFVCHRWISWTNNRRNDRSSSIHTTPVAHDDQQTQETKWYVRHRKAHDDSSS